MKSAMAGILATTLSVLAVNTMKAQDVGPNVHKIRDGIYVYLGHARNDFDTEHDSNAGIIITNDGVLLVDTGNEPSDARAILAVVKKLTPQPVKYIVLTEPHPDHYTGSWLFSPPATIITHTPGIASMKEVRTKSDVPRIKRMMSDPVQGPALDGYKLVVPQREFTGDKETLQVGERTIELLYLKNVHSEADIAVWLPKEKVLFSAGAAVVDQFNVYRPFVNVPDTLVALRKLKALKPEYVIPAHGVAGVPATARFLDEAEQFYGLLLDRVGKMVKDGKTLPQIKAELRMPEYSNWGSKGRFPFIIENAYNTVKGIPAPAFKVGEPCNYSPPPCPSK
jgi:glyoxylase-like metal-dependent hydrolase (beta-lactamase superfamily II)